MPKESEQPHIDPLTTPIGRRAQELTAEEHRQYEEAKRVMRDETFVPNLMAKMHAAHPPKTESVSEPIQPILPGFVSLEEDVVSVNTLQKPQIVKDTELLMGFSDKRFPSKKDTKRIEILAGKKTRKYNKAGKRNSAEERRYF